MRDLDALKWDRPLYQRPGGFYRLDALPVVYDFDWPDVLGHDRGQFPGGRSLALLVRKNCPSDKKPALLLTVREDVEEGLIEEGENLYAVIKINHYLREANSDPALTYYARKWESGIADIEHLKQIGQRPELVRAIFDEHLDFEHVVAWMRQHPDRALDVEAAAGSGAIERAPLARTVELATRALGALDTALTTGDRADFHDAVPMEEVLTVLARVLSHLPESMIDVLPKLGPDALQHVSALLGVVRLNGFISVYKENKLNPDEAFWQETLERDPWVISQLFCSPMVILGDQAYVGGKALNNTGGKLADFLYRNPLTRNSALVEIKTPTEPLLGSEYRDGIYPIGKGIQGAVTQVLTQQQELQRNIATLQMQARMRGEEDEFEAFRLRAVVIAGSFEAGSLSGEQIRSFELTRNGFKDVELVTFDEVARKVENLLELLAPAA